MKPIIELLELSERRKLYVSALQITHIVMPAGQSDIRSGCMVHLVGGAELRVQNPIDKVLNEWVEALSVVRR